MVLHVGEIQSHQKGNLILLISQVVPGEDDLPWLSRRYYFAYVLVIPQLRKNQNRAILHLRPVEPRAEENALHPVEKTEGDLPVNDFDHSLFNHGCQTSGGGIR